jgi:hypothetical protein
VPEEIFVAEERSAYRSADLGAVSCAELFAKVVMFISAVRCAHLGAGGSAVLSAKEGTLISAARCTQLGHLFCPPLNLVIVASPSHSDCAPLFLVICAAATSIPQRVHDTIAIAQRQF